MIYKGEARSRETNSEAPFLSSPWILGAGRAGKAGAEWLLPELCRTGMKPTHSPAERYLEE